MFGRMRERAPYIFVRRRRGFGEEERVAYFAGLPSLYKEER